MILLRFIILAGVVVAIGVYAPARAATARADSSVPAKVAFGSDTVEQKKKADSPPRPKPRPGPKDGGEDE